MFNKGDKLFDNLVPLVHVLYSGWKGKKCDYCFREAELRKCSGCYFMFYCSQLCQKLDWYPCHRVECKSKANLLFFDLSKCIDQQGKPKWKISKLQLIFRYLIKLKSSLIDNQTLQDTNLNQLQTNKSNVIKIAVIWTKLMESNYIKQYFGNFSSQFYSTYFIVQKYQIRITECSMIMNSLVPEFIMLGEGIYNQLNNYPHNCLANTAYVFNGINLTLSVIKANVNLNEININYLDVIGSPESICLPIDIRKNIIKIRGFKCNCKVCYLNDYWQDDDYKNLLLNLCALRKDLFRDPMNHISTLTHLIKYLKSKFNDLHPTITILMFRLAYFLTINNQWLDAKTILDNVRQELYLTHSKTEFDHFNLKYKPFCDALARSNLNEIQFLSKDFFNVTRFYRN